MSLTREQAREIAADIANYFSNKGINVAEHLYGYYQNAIVTHFPYRSPDQAGTETLEEAVEDLLSGEWITEVLEDFIEDSED